MPARLIEVIEAPKRKPATANYDLIVGSAAVTIAVLVTILVLINR